MTSPQPMKILQVSSRLPYPLTDGGAIGIYNITKALAHAGHAVTLVTFPLESQALTEQALRDLSRFATVRLAPKPMPSRMRALLASTFRGAYPIERRMMPEMFALLKDLLSTEHFDVVHADTSHVGRYALWLRDTYHLPVVLRMHNFETALYERYAAARKDPLRRAVASLHARRLRREEAHFLSTVEAVAAISDEDVRAMQQLAPAGHYHVIPAGIDTEYFSPASLEQATLPDALLEADGTLGERILSLGSMEWDPNFEGVKHFLDTIFPMIREARPGVRFDIVGGSPERIRPFAAPFGGAVRVHGRVPDVRPYLRASRLLVVPLGVGGGMRVKILEFFATGKPVVSTPIGAEGNRGVSGTHLFIAETDKTFANGVIDLLSDPGLRGRIGGNARALAVSEYSWETVGRAYSELYRSVVAETGLRHGRS